MGLSRKRSSREAYAAFSAASLMKLQWFCPSSRPPLPGSTSIGRTAPSLHNCAPRDGFGKVSIFRQQLFAIICIHVPTWLRGMQYSIYVSAEAALGCKTNVIWTATG